jgi:hypothetical protein
VIVPSWGRLFLALTGKIRESLELKDQKERVMTAASLFPCSGSDLVDQGFEFICSTNSFLT